MMHGWASAHDNSPQELFGCPRSGPRSGAESAVRLFIPESAFEPQSTPSPQRNPPYPKERREKKRGADRNILAQALDVGD